MRVELDSGEIVELGVTEVSPTIGITDYSRRVTDDFGVTTVVERNFSRSLSVKLLLPFADVDQTQRRLAALRATSALWVADERFASLSVRGFYKDFSLDLNTPPVSFCTLTVEGLAEAGAFVDPGGDPAPVGNASTLKLIQPVTVTPAVLTATNVAETDYPEWSAGTSYAAAARVIRASTHRVYESAIAGNAGNDPATGATQWIDVGPTNRWAMFDEALGTATARAGSIVVTLAPGVVTALALLDVVGATVRVQTTGIGGAVYDQTVAVGPGAITFLDLPAVGSPITVTIAGSGTVSVGTLLVGKLVTLGVTEAAPTAGITDYSRKEVDDFGEVTIVERAWAKRMTTRALISTAAIDTVFGRVAAVRARPCLWIGDDGLDSLTIFGFFKDFSIEVGETVSALSITVEGLSKAAPLADPAPPPFAWAGDWESGRTYQHNEIVRFGGRPFGSKADDNLGHQPPSAAIDDGYWFLFSDKGANGTPGSAGTPGAPGANGQTPYIHLAWANSADGSTGFSTTVSAGKMYVGIYSDFVEADSTNPALYSWSLIKGADGQGTTTLVNKNGMTISGGVATKTGGTNGVWDGSVHSAEGYSGDVVAIAQVPNASGSHIMLGLNTDPDTNESFNSIDFAVYAAVGSFDVYESNVAKGSYGAVSNGAFIYARRRGTTIEYGILGEAAPRYSHGGISATDKLYLDSSFFEVGAQLKSIQLTPLGKDGLDGTNGVPGAPGANGQTTYVHFAYADNSTGTLNFTTGAAGNRYYVGVYVDFTEADSTNPALYTWSLQRGADGSNGIPGAPGANGQPSYVHTAYATAADGSTGFHVSDPTGRNYLGVYTDFTLADSTNPVTYTWSLIKGADGAPGSAGAPGAPGVSAKSMSLSPDTIAATATYTGNTTSALPRYVTVTTLDGVTPTSPTLSITVSDSTNISASVSGNTVTITAINIDIGWIEVSASGYPPKRISIARTRSGAPGTDQASTYKDLGIVVATGSGAESFGGYPTSDTMLLQAAGGQLVLSGTGEYTADTPPSGVRRVSVKAMVYYRVAGSGSGWSTFSGPHTGGTAESQASLDAIASNISIGGTKTGLTNNTLYEVGVEFRRNSTTGSTAANGSCPTILSRT